MLIDAGMANGYADCIFSGQGALSHLNAQAHAPSRYPSRSTLWEGRSRTIPSLEVGAAVVAGLCIELTLYITLSLFPPTFQLHGAPIALKPSICLVDCIDSIFWLSVAMSYIPIMESTKRRRRRGAKPNTHAASGEHPKKRKTNPVGEVLD